MSNPFRIDPANGIFRAVINGDDAASPSSVQNVTFDAFGPPYMGVFAAGVVTLAQMTYSGTSSAGSWSIYIPFGKTFASPPQVLWLAQYASGAWSNQYVTGNAGLCSIYQITGDGNGTISNGVKGSGASCYAWGYATTTGIYLGATLNVISGSASVAPPPSAWSYRVFQV